jgi:hypothetical protein
MPCVSPDAEKHAPPLCFERLGLDQRLIRCPIDSAATADPKRKLARYCTLRQ